jgi:hypothetical protein
LCESAQTQLNHVAILLKTSESLTTAEDFKMNSTSAPSNDRTICRYCALESAVSHASERECIEELQREATRLRGHLQGRYAAAPAVAAAPVTSWGFGRDASRAWSPAGELGRSAAIVSLSLAGSNS